MAILPPPPPPPLENPYRPGAGHRPPYLAGREQAIADAEKYFDQKEILCNLILTGLRGVGKTVLLEELRKPATARNWFWVGTDLSESASISEETIATRLLTDLSIVTSGFEYTSSLPRKPGFTQEVETVRTRLDFHFLRDQFNRTPGLTADKLKAVLELSWNAIQSSGARGVIFAYDEAQNLADQSSKDQFPLSMMLEVFQSIQRKGIPFMLLLTGLPTLFQKLVDARTYAERMFHVVTLDRLSHEDSRKAITKPIESSQFKFTEQGINRIIDLTGGYPYFIQFICRESYDLVIRGDQLYEERLMSIVSKLDSDFFAGRWAKATDRQRDLLNLIADLDNADAEFSVQDIVDASKNTQRPFSNSHANQMLSSLSGAGLIFKNRHGKYAFAVPLLSRFIKRQRE